MWSGGPATGELALLRGVLLLLVAVGALGLMAELVLLEHTESVWQWVPLVLLGVVLASVALVASRPGPPSFRLFRVVMLLCVAAGLAGLYLHYDGNVQFELESDPSARGLDLIWRSLRGATPTLAPAALAQLGVIGLLFTFRHPAARRTGGDHSQETR